MVSICFLLNMSFIYNYVINGPINIPININIPTVSHYISDKQCAIVRRTFFCHPHFKRLGTVKSRS